jgi:hypothetical protein
MRASRLALKPRISTSSVAASLLLLAAAVLLLVLSAPAQAVTLELHHSKAKSATADFESTSGCIDTGMHLFAADDLVATNQRLGVKEVSVPPDHASEFFLGFDRFNHCTNTDVTGAEGRGPIADADFQIADDLSSASLNTTVTVHDFVTDTDLSAALDVDWTATGPATRESGLLLKDSVPGPDPFNIRIGDSATLRDAQAVGSVTVGGENLTPDPSVGANMFSGVFYFQAIGTPQH